MWLAQIAKKRRKKRRRRRRRRRRRKKRWKAQMRLISVEHHY